ncbi:hypothetical protein [Microbacterium sp. CIAB417]|uniref:hypothetical protein n=1 Tax=Microbacterium sp. CIAB417 TaxID=2860287 RepID=UPI001FAE308E|nr:hypothetical protein [Microbacterium sp. CIAB417]
MTTDASTPNPRGPEPAGVSAVLALVLSTISFFALAIVGLGALSFATDTDVIAVPDLGPAPGAIGMAAAVAAFAGVEWLAVRISRPVYRSVWVTALATVLVHLMVVSAGVLLAAGDVVVALAVAGGLVTTGPSLVILAAASVAAWGGVALRRTRAQHPTWPWEHDE